MKRAAHRAFPIAPSKRAAELLAAGSVCALLVNPVAAVELGDVRIDSALGQPLRASIAFALGPNERLTDECVYLHSAAAAGGLPAVTRAQASVRGQRIALRGKRPLLEPMMSLTLVVDCPYTPHLRRDYLLLLNPPGLAARTEPVEASAATPAVVSRHSDAAPARPERPLEPRPAVVATPIEAGRSYRVQPGDTLSEITSRISDRRVRLWPAIEAIFAANPAAFRNGDVDRLIAGATLRIPQSVVTGAAAPPAVAERVAYPGTATATPAVPDIAPPPRIEDANPPPTTSDAAAATTPAASDQRSAAATAYPAATEAAAETSAAVTTDDAAPADSPDRSVRKLVPTASPAAPAARREAANRALPAEPIPLAGGADSPAQSWLVWLGGGGVAIFLALLIFGRRLRERFDGDAQVVAEPDTEETAINEALHARRSTDRQGTDSASVVDDGGDAALDFSFEASGEFRNELDFIVEESQITSFPPTDLGFPDDDSQPTREMPRAEESPRADTAQDDALTDEFPPLGKRPKDLETIEVEALDSRPRAALDLTTEFDYEVLEQDYEKELTATHALNMEIEQAARELQRKLGDADDDTSQISMAADLDGTAEVTAAMPADMVPSRATAGNDEPGVEDDSETASDEAPTSKLSQSDETLEMDPDATVEHRSKTG